MACKVILDEVSEFLLVTSSRRNDELNHSRITLAVEVLIFGSDKV